MKGISNGAGYAYGTACAIGTTIYAFGGNSVSKYDTLTDTWTNNYHYFNNGINVQSGCCAVIDEQIYIISGQVLYRYDYKEDYLYTVASTPINFNGGSMVAYGGNLYIFKGTDMYQYIVSTNTFTKVSTIPTSYSQKSLGVLVENKVYLLSSTNNTNGVTQCVQIDSKEYSDNSVIITQGRLYQSGYAVKLFNNKMFDPLPKYAFADAWYYTTENGLDGTMPVYYGDGTQWINFKNPPVEEVEE